VSQTELSVYRRADTLRQALLRAMLDSHRLMAIPDKSHFVVNVGGDQRYEARKEFR
jgi:hypothetical protein